MTTTKVPATPKLLLSFLFAVTKQITLWKLNKSVKDSGTVVVIGGGGGGGGVEIFFPLLCVQDLNDILKTLVCFPMIFYVSKILAYMCKQYIGSGCVHCRKAFATCGLNYWIGNGLYWIAMQMNFMCLSHAQHSIYQMSCGNAHTKIRFQCKPVQTSWSRYSLELVTF